MITSYEILDYLAAAIAADAEFAAFAVGLGKTLTLQLGGNPQKAVNTTDCPLVALMPGDLDEIGIETPENIFHVEIAWFISCGDFIDSPVAGDSSILRRNYTAIQQLSDLGGHLRRILKTALASTNLCLQSAKQALTYDDPKAWPLSRGDLICTLTISRASGGMEPSLT